MIKFRTFGAMIIFVLGLGLAVATVAQEGAQESKAMDSAQNTFVRDCKSWFWDCDCAAKDLFPAAVRSLREESYDKKLVALERACEDNSWDSLRINLNRVLTTEDFKKLGLEPPARRAMPTIAPCIVAKKLEEVDVDEFIDIPDTSRIWLEVSSQVACRNAAGIRESAVRSCSQFVNSQEYNCDCYADRYSEFWMSESEAFSSVLDNQASSEAMARCRRK